MERISNLRFNALAGYTRKPQAALLFEELEWYSEGRERVLAAIVRDIYDEDFSAVIVGRDARGRFRAVNLLPWVDSVNGARFFLESSMRDWAAKPDDDYHQGDERGRPVDLFTPVVPRSRFHPSFAAIWNEEIYSPAREIISAMSYYFEDPDGNFVEQFQTTGFDARVWELYLFAALHELGYAFDRTYPAPDYFRRGILGEFFVEAVTVNPTLVNRISLETGPPESETGRREYCANYMPVKYGSSLYSKLNMRYWELPHVNHRPILIAVQDFHFPGSMKWSEPSLAPYLYGRSFAALYDACGHLNIRSTLIQEQRWGAKTIPSGFFARPDSENISAIITNAQGTLTKFNRIGFKAGFGSQRVRMIRRGTRYNHSANAAFPVPFVDLVHKPEYVEGWSEGMNVYHNPRAIAPVPREFLPAAAHHFLTAEGQIRSLIPENHPFGSETVIVSSQ